MKEFIIKLVVALVITTAFVVFLYSQYERGKMEVSIETTTRKLERCLDRSRECLVEMSYLRGRLDSGSLTAEEEEKIGKCVNP